MDKRSKDLRHKIIKTALAGGRGHIPSAFSIVEILRVLYDSVLRPNDHLILSKGHGCLALYVMLWDKGLISQNDLDNFCKSSGILGGHPSHHIPGVEFSTGSLGHGLSLGVGLALARPRDRVYVLLGDGECDEGQVWEAAIDAGNQHISNLWALIDLNHMQSYGRLLADHDLFIRRWKDCKWETGYCAGWDTGDILYELSAPDFIERPRVIFFDTVKGYGCPSIENNPAAHHKDKFTQEEAEALLKELEAQP